MTKEEILNRLQEILPNNPNLEPMADMITQVMEFNEETLTASMTQTMIQVLNTMFNETITTEIINSVKEGLDDKNITRVDILRYLSGFETEVQKLINDLNPTINQRTLLNAMFKPMIDVFSTVANEYHNYNITLPMTLDEGAKEPTYAHNTDVCADLYAADDMVVPAHSTSNMIRTGVHIQLPEGWMAMIFPRSSIGANTGLRLSNSVGIIDTGYLGALGVLYDNISDSDYTIHAGDRIAQIMVMPNYRFKAQVVDHLKETDRGEGGFGSSGK